MTRSYVVTGGGRGIGQAIAVRLSEDGHVVAIDIDGDALSWTRDYSRVAAVVGDSDDEAVAERAADFAANAGSPLVG